MTGIRKQFIKLADPAQEIGWKELKEIIDRSLGDRK